MISNVVYPFETLFEWGFCNQFMDTKIMNENLSATAA